LISRSHYCEEGWNRKKGKKGKYMPQEPTNGHQSSKAKLMEESGCEIPTQISIIEIVIPPC